MFFYKNLILKVPMQIVNVIILNNIAMLNFTLNTIIIVT